MLHQPGGAGEGEDDFLVVFDVSGGEGLAFAVFEPFLGGLVAADIELPCGGGNLADAGGFEKFGVAAAVGGAVQYGVDVVEQGFGGKTAAWCHTGICGTGFGFTGFQAALGQGLHFGTVIEGVGETSLVAESLQLGGVNIGAAAEAVVKVQNHHLFTDTDQRVVGS